MLRALIPGPRGLHADSARGKALRGRSAVSMLLAAATAVIAGGCVGLKTASAPSVPASGIRGKVLVDDTDPAAGAFVYAYYSPKNQMRLPTALISSPSAGDGGYTLNLAPGDYYIVARKRLSGGYAGHLDLGDLEGRYPSNPVTVKPGEFTAVDLSITPLPGKLLLAPFANQKRETGISGKVYLKDGTPAKGAYVMLYLRQDRIGRPDVLSRPTGRNGEYTIYLKKPGTYYISARTSHGDLPRKGELYGTYDANPEHKVVVEDRSILTGIDVTLNKFTRDLTKCSEH